jgi:Mg2+ and Co2+ transporter CorA
MKTKAEILDQIDVLHKTDIYNPEHSSIFFESEYYALLIVRFFRIGNDELEGVSVPFVLFEEDMYQFNRQTDDFELMQKGFVSVHEQIHKELQYNERLVDRYVEQVDKLEDSLYTRKISPIFLDVWFDLKKDLTRMSRMFLRTEEAFNKYMQGFGDKASFHMDECLDLLEHVRRYQRMSDLNTIKLDTLYNYYNSLKNDKMNKNIYTLTVLSGIFLPLNLIVGFFGMNTEGLFFSGNAAGTQNVVMLLGVLFVILLLLFPLVRFIEHYILNKILGRFNLYHNLVKGIKKITIFPKD